MTDKKQPKVEAVREPRDSKAGYSHTILCPVCGRRIYSWRFGEMKCPMCGGTIRVSK